MKENSTHWGSFDYIQCVRKINFNCQYPFQPISHVKLPSANLSKSRQNHSIHRVSRWRFSFIPRGIRESSHTAERQIFHVLFLLKQFFFSSSSQPFFSLFVKCLKINKTARLNKKKSAERIEKTEFSWSALFSARNPEFVKFCSNAATQ